MVRPAQTSRTVISFCVSVPVLSLQITDAEPSVSTNHASMSPTATCAGVTEIRDDRRYLTKKAIDWASE